MNVKKWARLIAWSVPIYAFSWIAAFAMIVGVDKGAWDYCLEYFALAWTFRGLELPGFTWLLSLVIFAATWLAVLMVARLRRRDPAAE